MNHTAPTRFERLLTLILAALLGTALTLSAAADDDRWAVSVADDDAWTDLGPTELEELVGPIALYPDDLLAIVLPAAVYPLQLVEAQRLLERRDADSALEPDEDWDDSVVALLNYPEVLDLLNEDLDWTLQLGEAVIRQEDEVLGAIERFRERAYTAGNLRSDDRQVVERRDSVIEVRPVEEEIIYVPYYEPSRVIVYQTVPVYHYHPRPRPVYYHPLSVDLWFGRGVFWGVSTYFRVGWQTRHIHVYHHGHMRHPFYGRAYRYGKYRSWYHHRGLVHHHVFHQPHPRWRPRHGYHQFRWHARRHGSTPLQQERRVAPGRHHYQARQEAPPPRGEDRGQPRQRFTTRIPGRENTRPVQHKRAAVASAPRIEPDRRGRQAAPPSPPPPAASIQSTRKRAAVSPSRLIHDREGDRQRGLHYQAPRHPETISRVERHPAHRVTTRDRPAADAAPRIVRQQPTRSTAVTHRPPTLATDSIRSSRAAAAPAKPSLHRAPPPRQTAPSARDGGIRSERGPQRRER